MISRVPLEQRYLAVINRYDLYIFFFHRHFNLFVTFLTLIRFGWTYYKRTFFFSFLLVSESKSLIDIIYTRSLWFFNNNRDFSYDNRRFPLAIYHPNIADGQRIRFLNDNLSIRYCCACRLVENYTLDSPPSTIAGTRFLSPVKLFHSLSGHRSATTISRNCINCVSKKFKYRVENTKNA